MSLNEEFVAKEDVIATKSEEKKKKKLTPRKKMKIYYSIFGAFLAVVVIIGALMTYQALTYVVGVFSDYSMAPLINKEIKDKDGKVYTYENFSDRDGNIVEYGLINPAKNIKEYKRFDVVAIQEYKVGHFLNDGIDYSGKVVCKDIGISVWDEKVIKRIDDRDDKKNFEERLKNEEWEKIMNN